MIRTVKYFIVGLTVIFASCSTPLESVRALEKGFAEKEAELIFFAKRYNSGKRTTRDRKLISQYFDRATDLLNFAQANCRKYEGLIKKLKNKKKIYKVNIYFDPKMALYDYSYKALLKKKTKELKSITMSESYKFSFSLKTKDIIQIRPSWFKPGASKKYKSIKKRFN